MVSYYDNWERLVEAVMRREQFRQLSLLESRTPSARSFDSDFSFSSSNSQFQDSSFSTIPSPLHPDDALKLKLGQTVNEGKRSWIGKVSPKRRGAMWKGLSIFGGFSSKKDYGREEREAKWAKSHNTSHGLERMKSDGLFGKQKKNDEVSAVEEEGKRRTEMARLRELHTLKGHIESLMKAKGLDIDSINHYYTV